MLLTLSSYHLSLNVNKNIIVRIHYSCLIYNSTASSDVFITLLIYIQQTLATETVVDASVIQKYVGVIF